MPLEFQSIEWGIAVCLSVFPLPSTVALCIEENRVVVGADFCAGARLYLTVAKCGDSPCVGFGETPEASKSRLVSLNGRIFMSRLVLPYGQYRRSRKTIVSENHELILLRKLAQDLAQLLDDPVIKPVAVKVEEGELNKVNNKLKVRVGIMVVGRTSLRIVSRSIYEHVRSIMNMLSRPALTSYSFYIVLLESPELVLEDVRKHLDGQDLIFVIGRVYRTTSLRLVQRLISDANLRNRVAVCVSPTRAPAPEEVKDSRLVIANLATHGTSEYMYIVKSVKELAKGAKVSQIAPRVYVVHNVSDPSKVVDTLSRLVNRKVGIVLGYLDNPTKTFTLL